MPSNSCFSPISALLGLLPSIIYLPNHMGLGPLTHTPAFQELMKYYSLSITKLNTGSLLRT